MSLADAAQEQSLGEHTRVAEDHAVKPVLLVGVKLGLVRTFGDAVEVGEEVGNEVTVVVLECLDGFVGGRLFFGGLIQKGDWVS